MNHHIHENKNALSQTQETVGQYTDEEVESKSKTALTNLGHVKPTILYNASTPVSLATDVHDIKAHATKDFIYNKDLHANSVISGNSNKNGLLTHEPAKNDLELSSLAPVEKDIQKPLGK